MPIAVFDSLLLEPAVWRWIGGSGGKFADLPKAVPRPQQTDPAVPHRRYQQPDATGPRQVGGQAEIDRVGAGIEHQVKCALFVFMEQTGKLFFFRVSPVG